MLCDSEMRKGEMVVRGCSTLIPCVILSVKRVCRMMKARLALCSLSLDIMSCCSETRKGEMVERGSSTLIPCLSLFL